MMKRIKFHYIKIILVLLPVGGLIVCGSEIWEVIGSTPRPANKNKWLYEKLTGHNLETIKEQRYTTPSPTFYLIFLITFQHINNL